MAGLLAGVLRRLLTLSGQAASGLRRVLLGLAYPGLSFGPGVTLGRGIRIRVTDGVREYGAGHGLLDVPAVLPEAQAAGE